MKFKVKAYISTDDDRLITMISEIYQMPNSMIDDGINSCRLAVEGEVEGLSWGFEVFELLLGKEKSILEYHGQEIIEIPTKEILQMLVDYKNIVNFLNTKET